MIQKIRERLMCRRMARTRELFRFFDGKRFRSLDPWLTHRLFDTHKNFKWELGEAVDAGDSEATSITIDACHELFGTTPWDGKSGLTEAEVLGIFVDFLDYIDTLKKKLSPGLTSLPPTESESSISVEPPRETMNSRADSHSIPSAVS